MDIYDIKEIWDTVMTQAVFSIDNGRTVITFYGENGGFVKMDAQLFVDALIVVDSTDKAIKK